MSMQTANKLTCFHCGEECNGKKIVSADKLFCCDGCKMVYEILNESGLCTYYDLNKNPGSAQTIQVREDKFTFLDDEKITKKLIQFTDEKQTHVVFYLPQMHCSSCLWLLENIHRINEGVIASRVNFAKKEVFLVFNNSTTSLRKVVETLTSIGYEPHLSLQDINNQKPRLWDKSRVYKIGIAGFCFSNIMMMSFPEYFAFGGYLEKEIGNTLKYLIVGLSLPVLFYCASEFFTSAWKGLKNKFLNIDAPIALAIAVTFIRSIYEIVTGTGSGYLDSMSGIVFFMLWGRLLQDKTYRSFSFDRDFTSFFPIAVNVVKDGEVKPVAISEVKVNDVIQIHAHELIPVDAILSKGHASIDYSFVSGESLPVRKTAGEIIYAGGKQLGGIIELIVVKEVSQSYLTGLWNKDVFKREKQSKKSFIHFISTWFTFLVLAIGAGAGLFWYLHDEPKLMWNALTTVLIVACPCALLLSATFTNGNILRILSKHKLYLRHPDVIEDLANVNHVVFDKTGTVTESKKVNVHYIGKILPAYEETLVVSLLSQSNHPMSVAVLNFLKTKNSNTGLINSAIEHFKVSEGKGIEAWIDEKHIRVGSGEFVNTEVITPNETAVYIKIDNLVYGKFVVANKYRVGFPRLIALLKRRYALSVLSGDNAGEKNHIEQMLGNENEALFNQQPGDKLEYIQQLQNYSGTSVLMVGDGLNDSGALRQADVGIAVCESDNKFTPACDGILEATQFYRIASFLSFAKAGKRIIIASFILSVLYNIVGLSFAVQGTLSPLIAAILMPASSISIILITYGLSELVAWKKGFR